MDYLSYEGLLRYHELIDARKADNDEVVKVIAQELTDDLKSQARSNIGAGAITGITMNGASKGTSGTIDLGTVLTSHQDISGKVDKTTTVNGHALSSNVTVTKSDVGLGNVTNDAQVKRSEMGATSGVATLDSAGKVPSSQLPTYTKTEIDTIITDNELIVSNALNDLERRKLDSSAYTPVDLSNYYTKSEISTVLSNKADKTVVDDLSGQSETVAAALVDLNTKITAHTADTNVHFTTNDRLKWETLNRRTRKNFTDSGMTYFINTLKSAIADQDLEKYGLKVGDYCTATHDGKTYNYVIAGLNTMRGTSSASERLNYDHIGIIVDTDDTYAWNISKSTTTSQNTHETDGTWTTGTAAAGYASCDLQYYLEHTVLPNVESDLGSDNVKSHDKLYSNAVNTSGYNRFGSPEGCSSSYDWYTNQKICALSEIQVYGSTIWSSSGYDTGEACRQLDVFRVYNMNEIFEGRYPWLRDVASSSTACAVSDYGNASISLARYAANVAALILFA